MLPWETCTTTTGDGTLMIQLKAVTGLETRTPFTTCAVKPQRPFSNWSPTACRSQEPKKEKFIKGHLEVNQKKWEKVDLFLFRTSIQDLRSRRQDWTCHAPYPFRKVPRLQLHFLHRILRPRSHHGQLRNLQRSHCHVHCRWNHPQNQSTQHSAGNWRIRKSLPDLHIRPHLHWRRRRNGHQSWASPF